MVQEMTKNNTWKSNHFFGTNYSISPLSVSSFSI